MSPRSVAGLRAQAGFKNPKRAWQEAGTPRMGVSFLCFPSSLVDKQQSNLLLAPDLYFQRLTSHSYFIMTLNVNG